MKITDNQAKVIADGFIIDFLNRQPIKAKDSHSLKIPINSDSENYLITIRISSLFGFKFINHAYLHSYNKKTGLHLDLTKTQRKLILDSLLMFANDDSMINMNIEEMKKDLFGEDNLGKSK